MPFINDGKGKPIDNSESQIWYHGSPLFLEMLAAGSSITRNRELAIAFSHKPTQLGVSDDGKISHNGKENGYLYEIAKYVSLEDIFVHPDVASISPNDQWEWVTKRPFRLNLIQETIA
jgi:hypothetical protein